MRKLALIVLGGCNLYFPSTTNAPPDACVQQGSGSGPATQVDPSTGQCETLQGWPCNEEQPTWPFCSGPCDGLSEPACLANTACHAAYIDTPGNSSASRVYSACWTMAAPQTNPNTPCAGLDAVTCAAQHQCASLMLVETDIEHFESCFATAGAGGSGCADAGICYGSVQCTDAPPACPPGTVAGIANGCWSGYCIPTTKCPV